MPPTSPELNPLQDAQDTDQYTELTQALEQTFPRLRFPEPFESEYASHKFEALKARSVVVAWCGLILNLAYITSDFLLLPDLVYPTTVAIRIAITTPLVMFLLLMKRVNFTERSFLALYMSLYLLSGLAVIAISVIVRVNDVAIPYEGVLLIMMFGYLIMAIPFRLALAGAGLLFVLYSVAELFLGYSYWVLIYNLFFILTANVIGAVGCYIQERSDRRNYVNDRLLQLARDSAEHQSVRKTHIMAEASHDLRQPLHAMTLLVEALSAKPIDDDQKLLTGQLQSSLVHLNQLLGAMFDMSKLEMGIISPKLQAVDIHVLIRQVVRELVPNDKVSVRIVEVRDHNGPVFIRTDPVLLGRMLRNLLENAQVHAHATLIEIGCEQSGDSTSDRVSIFIRDNGRGIPKSHQQKIFQSFYKGPEDTGQGLGLGLSIVRNLADMLDVEMSLESEAGKGACFRLLVAMTAMEPRVVNTPDASTLDQRLKRILLVDNERVILDSASQLLSQWGYEVTCLDQIEQVEDYLANASVDLLITDYHFDLGLSAGSLLEKLSVSRPALPIILLTADTRVTSSQFSHPGLDVFYKPIAPAKLRAALLRKMLD